jgi:alpha-galactosidase
LNIPIREYIRRSVKNNDEYENNKKIAFGEEPLPVLKKSVEYASRIIYAMETGKHTTVHGNIKNTGLIPNLPVNCCVEVPILINKNGFQPTYFDELPPQFGDAQLKVYRFFPHCSVRYPPVNRNIFSTAL